MRTPLSASILVVFLLFSVTASARNPGKSDASAGEISDPSIRDVTTVLPWIQLEVIGDARDVKMERMGSPGSGAVSRAPRPPSLFAGWEVVQSLTGEILVPQGQTYEIYFDATMHTMVEVVPPLGLTAEALAAVAKAPDWLKTDLTDAFWRLDAGRQDTYAGVILGAVDPYVDEIAFTIAHTSPQTLTNSNFYPELIVENAEGIYAVDPDIAYADIVDTGDSVTGGDYFSTVRYRVGVGGADEYEQPREIYYWHIVLPQITDEVPTYIHPTSDTCDLVTDPPAGVFWRTYLWSNTDDPANHPILRDELAGIDSLWNELPNTAGAANGALGVVTDWINAVFTWTGGPLPSCGPPEPSRRPIQPISIYHRHVGRCGEHADLTEAVCRTALIPAIQNLANLNDHVWNEVYDRRWVQYEPENTMIDDFTRYDGWWTNGATIVWGWRGDGYMWSVTERYTDSCRLDCNIRDAGGLPVDGAKVLLAARAESDPTGIYVAGYGFTDSQGHVSFTLGSGQDYWARVDSVVGGDPATPNQVYTVIADSVAGMVYTWEPTGIPDPMPDFLISAGTPPGNPLDDYRLDISYSVPKEIMYGRMFSGDFTQAVPGVVDFFICDPPNYTAFTGGLPFEAFEIGLDSVSGTTSFVIPTDENWHALITNHRNVVNSEVISVTADLYWNAPAGPPPVDLIYLARSLDAESVVIDWDDVTGVDVAGYNVYRSGVAQEVTSARMKPELDPFILDGPDPTTTESTYTDTIAGGGAMDFFNVRTYGTDGSIAYR